MKILELLKNKYAIGFAIGVITVSMFVVYLSAKENQDRLQYLSNYEKKELMRLGIDCEASVSNLKLSLLEDFRSTNNAPTYVIPTSVVKKYDSFREQFFQCFRLSSTENLKRYHVRYQEIHEDLTSIVVIMKYGSESGKKNELPKEILKIEELLNSTI